LSLISRSYSSGYCLSY